MDAAEKPLVLIVDDDNLLAQSIQAFFDENGYKTQVVLSGEDAKQFLLETKPDLMTLDIKMPGMSGIDLLAYFRGSETLEGVKIILLSGMPAEQLMMGVVGGADWVMEKPVDFNYLLNRANNLLS